MRETELKETPFKKNSGARIQNSEGNSEGSIQTPSLFERWEPIGGNRIQELGVGSWELGVGRQELGDRRNPGGSNQEEICKNWKFRKIGRADL